MNKNLTSNKIENDEFNFNAKDSDYRNLSIRLKEISKTISLLEKTKFSGIKSF